MSAGIMITVSGRYEEQTLSCQPLLPLQHTHTPTGADKSRCAGLTHTHTQSRARLSLLGDIGVAHTG